MLLYQRELLENLLANIDSQERRLLLFKGAIAA
jgi:hypothetical protein